jgi:acetate kinase
MAPISPRPTLRSSSRERVPSWTLCWIGWSPRCPIDGLGGVGHRVVHGMLRTAPERVTEELLHELKGIIPFDPEHLPREIELIEAVRHRHPKLPQAVCFDTAFHRSMPLVATQLPIPRRYGAKGIQRYGFHGLSYTFLMQELARLGDPRPFEAASFWRIWAAAPVWRR